MPMASLEAYLDRLPARMSELKMLMADPIILPHLKKEAQIKMMSQWMTGISNSRSASKPVPAKLRMMGVGVRFESQTPPDLGEIG